MNEIINNYKQQVENYKAEKAEISVQIEKVEAQIERANKKLSRLKEKEIQLMAQSPTRYDIVDALAKKLSEHYGLPYERYGPYGLECETSIYLRKDMAKRISEQPTICLRLRPFGDKENDWMTYDTGKRIDRYARGSIGELNGYNSVYASLPKNFNEIIKIIESDERNNEALVDKKPALDDVISSCEKVSSKISEQSNKKETLIER